jgi:CheY-like chemotaxis protein
MPVEEVPPHNTQSVLLVDDDLFFSARILSVLRNLGFRAEAARTVAEAEQKTRSGQDLVIFNFGSARLGELETIRSIKSAGAPRLLAFLSHVKIPAVRDAVLAAGADSLVPNSAITQRLPEILARLMSNEPLPDDLEDGSE